MLMTRNRMGFISNSFFFSILRRSCNGPLPTFLATAHSPQHIAVLRTVDTRFLRLSLTEYTGLRSRASLLQSPTHIQAPPSLDYDIITSVNHLSSGHHTPHVRDHHHACPEKDQALARNERISEMSILPSTADGSWSEILNTGPTWKGTVAESSRRNESTDTT